MSSLTPPLWSWWCYLCSKKLCHSVDPCSCHQLLKHRCCKPPHTGVQGGHRKLCWSCTLTCDLCRSQLQQCSIWRCHWPPTTRELDAAHMCARLRCWWEDTVLRGNKNEYVWGCVQCLSALLILNDDQSTFLTRLHCDLFAWKTEARPGDGEDHHCVGASTQQVSRCAICLCGVTVQGATHPSGDGRGVVFSWNWDVPGDRQLAGHAGHTGLHILRAAWH